MSGHWIIVPVLLPALTGALCLLALRERLAAARVVSTAATLLLLLTGLGLLRETGAEAYFLGDWPAPFGIVLVRDRLAALMVTLAALLALIAQAHAIASGEDGRGKHFHALWQFQLMGLGGAFLTGDAFNLFVFFEVLLIASYGLMIHGGGAARLKAGVQYVVVNLVGSTLFLLALATVYSVTGTLNMADLAVKLPLLPEGDFALIRLAGTMLLAVFALKAALVPLHVWLPATYAEAPAPVAALFAVMTKVGVYAALRCLTLIFPETLPATGGFFTAVLGGAAALTLLAGGFGGLGAGGLPRLAGFATIVSTGTIFAALSQATPEATGAALYYLVHSTLAGGLLFLTADLARQGARGPAAALVMAAAVAAVGLPPLSGFPAKLMVLQALRGEAMALLWPALLIASFLLLLAFARTGSDLCWKAAPQGPAPAPRRLVPAFVLLALLALLTLAAGPATLWLDATAQSLHDPSVYIAANRLGEE